MAGLAAGLPAAAGHATQTLAVSTQVSPSAVVGFEISAQPLEITAADLDRGYVDVVMKSRVRVAGADARPNVVMGIEPRADLFKSMAVASSGNGQSANGNGKSANANGHSANGNGHSSNGNGHSASGNGHSPNGNGHAANGDAHAAEVSIDSPSAPKATQVSAGQFAEFRYRFEFSNAAREGRYETAISVAIDL